MSHRAFEAGNVAVVKLEQVVEFMIASIDSCDFYILCPDNDVDRETDNKRMAWAMGDVIENRAPVSRWHPDYQASLEALLRQ